MPYYVFVTGGVASSVGKGVCTASLAALMQARGYRVCCRKFDPYLNVDPGTMSPCQHGEVFVTDDGAETDLDFGHYERFTGVSFCGTDSVTSGKIYQSVIRREREGGYLGGTVQVIPHVTDAIREAVFCDPGRADIFLTEIGGTVGDMESLPFLEAIRQIDFGLRREGRVLFIHVTLAPRIGSTGEVKTKPTQHSVRELRSLGIQPDIILVRGSSALPAEERGKIARLCSIDMESVKSLRDLDTIYRAPLVLHDEGLDERVCRLFGLPDRHPDLSVWKGIVSALEESDSSVRIAIVGKYTDHPDAYRSLVEALGHGGIAARVRIEPFWVDSGRLGDAAQTEAILATSDAILVPGGFGKRGADGKLNAIRHARRKGVPFLGICLGMQLAVIEAARSFGGLPEAGSTEFANADREPDREPESAARAPVVCHMEKWTGPDGRVHVRRVDGEMGGTMRLGSYPAVLRPGSRISDIYGGQTLIHERHRHRYEVNAEYGPLLESRGLVFSGTSPDGLLPEVVEIPSHPWFIGVQFHPELKSRPFAPHPLFASLVAAARARRDGHAAMPVTVASGADVPAALS